MEEGGFILLRLSPAQAGGGGEGGGTRFPFSSLSFYRELHFSTLFYNRKGGGGGGENSNKQGKEGEGERAR